MRSRRDHLKAIFVAVALTMSATAHAAEEGASPNGTGFSAHMSKISALKRETDELEEQIKRVIEEKREASDEKAVRAMTLEIAEKYRALETASEKLEAETALVRFHYPEQSEKLDRKYVRFKKKSLKDLESEAGIDAKLDRIRDHVLATFPVPEIEKQKTEAPKVSPLFIRAPASVEDDVPEKIVLKK